jgi:hypothetical protein
VHISWGFAASARTSALIANDVRAGPKLSVLSNFVDPPDDDVVMPAEREEVELEVEVEVAVGLVLGSGSAGAGATHFTRRRLRVGGRTRVYFSETSAGSRG